MRKKSLITITILFILLFGISLVQADDVDNKLVQEAMDNYVKGKLSSQGYTADGETARSHQN